MKSNNNPSKDKKNNEDKNLSNFSSQKRSNKFDLISGGGNRPNDPGSKNQFASLSPKEKIKKIWKWISLVIYLFLAGLTITGLIQSCVLRTSSTVGAGVELYSKSEDVAPYVSTFQIVEKKQKVIKYDSNGNPVVDDKGNIVYEEQTYYVLEIRENANYLADKNDIKEIQTQLENIYSKYGAEVGKEIASLYGQYDNFSSSLRILSTTGVELESGVSNLNPSASEVNGLLNGDLTGNNIFLNNKILDYLNKNSLKYIEQNTQQNINLFVIKRPTNWNSLTDDQKDYYGFGQTNIGSSFKTWETIDGKDYEITTIGDRYYTQDVNADGIIDSSTLVEITDSNRISKFQYSLEAEVATLNKDKEVHNSEAFARDYLLSLLSVQLRFKQHKDLYDTVNKTNSTTYEPTATEVFQAFSKSNFEALVSSNQKFSLKVKNAILTYQNEIVSLLQSIGFGIRKQVYSDETSENYEPSNTTPFEIEFLSTQNDKANVVVGTGAVAQKPITSWADSWRLGPFYGLVVYPLSFMINGMMSDMPKMDGWSGIIAIVISILVTRVIATLFTYKSLFTSHKQQQLNPKKAKIDAKYEPFKGNREMEQRKRQEISKLYKANNVSMVQPLKSMCISMPIFFAVWRVVQGIPDIKSTTWLGIQFSLTSWRELFAGEWQYLPLLLMAAGIQALSQLLPRILNNKRMKERSNKAEMAALRKANKTQNIMMVVFIFMSVIFEAGVQIYWIVGGIWQIVQTLAVHHIVKSEWYRTKGYKYV